MLNSANKVKLKCQLCILNGNLLRGGGGGGGLKICDVFLEFNSSFSWQKCYDPLQG